MTELAAVFNRVTDPLCIQRRALITYLKVKTEAEDWHAVADAAMDIREIDARLAERNRGPSL
jgi:hypothetical protein